MDKVCEIYQWHLHISNFDGLTEAVNQSHQDYPTSTLGVGTGWSGPKTLFDDKRTKALKGTISFLIARMLGVLYFENNTDWIISGWGNIMLRGDTITRHNHLLSHFGGNNNFAGCYYLSTNSDSPPLKVYADPTVEIMPIPGNLVMFSADCDHSVTKQENDYRRISIGFNVKKNNTRRRNDF